MRRLTDTDYVGMLRAADPGSPVLRPGRTVVVSGPASPPMWSARPTLGWARFRPPSSCWSRARR